MSQKSRKQKKAMVPRITTRFLRWAQRGGGRIHQRR